MAKKKIEAEEIVSELSKTATTPREYVDLKIEGPLVLQNGILRNHVEFSNVTFESFVKINNCVFEQFLAFNKCVFKDHLLISSSKIENTSLTMRDCEHRKLVNLHKNIFKSHVNIVQAKFFEELTFTENLFSNCNLFLENSVIYKDFVLERNTFSKTILSLVNNEISGRIWTEQGLAEVIHLCLQSNLVFEFSYPLKKD